MRQSTGRSCRIMVAAALLLLGCGCNGIAFGEDLSAWGSYGPCGPNAISKTKASHVVAVGKSLANVPTDGIDVIECRSWTGMGPTNIVDCGGRPYTYCLLNDNDGCGNYVMLGVREKAGNVLLWNKLGSVDEIANSEIGPGFQQISYKFADWQEAQIVPGQFGNGLFVNHDTNEGWTNDGGNFFAVNLNDVGVTPEKGTIEFWFEFKYDSSVHNHAFFFTTRNALTDHFPNRNIGTNAYISAGWNGWDYGSYGKRFWFGIGNASDSSAVNILTPDYSAAPGGHLDFNDGTTFHFACVWDVNGIDGTADTVRLYVNGNVEASSNGTWSTTGGFDPYLYLGSSSTYENWDHYYNAVKGVTDNIVIRDYAKTDFSDRFQENPTGLVLSNTLSSYEAVHNSIVGPDLVYYEYNSSDPIAGVANRGYIPGLNGNAITIADGSYSNMQRIHNVVLNNAQDYVDPTKGTVQFWYKQNEKPVDYNHGIYRIFGGGYGLGSGIAVQSSVVSGEARLVFALSFGGTSVAAYGEDQKVGYNIDIHEDEWIHITAAWDRNGIAGSSDTLRLYVNDELVAKDSSNNWGTSVGSRVDIAGANDNNCAYKFAMSDLMLWDHAKVPSVLDTDSDGISDNDDNCPDIANPNQYDLDNDNIGDVCDIDIDGDGVENTDDNCAWTANVDQEDTDFDGFGDACDDDDDNDGVLDTDDNCSLLSNPGQEDADEDGQGDVCDGDLDGDGVDNETDNCPNVANGSQADYDSDMIGDACDDDIDGDGVVEDDDACPFTELDFIVDSAGCSIDQLCPCEGPQGIASLWKNQGKYVSCTAKSAESFVEDGLITKVEKDAIVSDAAQSDCGDKK